MSRRSARNRYCEPIGPHLQQHMAFQKLLADFFGRNNDEPTMPEVKKENENAVDNERKDASVESGVAGPVAGVGVPQGPASGVGVPGPVTWSRKVDVKKKVGEPGPAAEVGVPQGPVTRSRKMQSRKQLKKQKSLDPPLELVCHKAPPVELVRQDPSLGAGK